MSPGVSSGKPRSFLRFAPGVIGLVNGRTRGNCFRNRKTAGREPEGPWLARHGNCPLCGRPGRGGSGRGRRFQPTCSRDSLAVEAMVSDRDPSRAHPARGTPPGCFTRRAPVKETIMKQANNVVVKYFWPRFFVYSSTVVQLLWVPIHHCEYVA